MVVNMLGNHSKNVAGLNLNGPILTHVNPGSFHVAISSLHKTVTRSEATDKEDIAFPRHCCDLSSQSFLKYPDSESI